MKGFLRLLFVFCCACCLVYGDEKASVLIGVPVRQSPAVLKEYLASFDRSAQETYTLDYFFVDDNVDPKSSELLQEFTKNHNCIIYRAKNDEQMYENHEWRDEVMWKVAYFKDMIIEYARTKGYDYYFQIDSDTLLHPKAIDTLIGAKKDIVTNLLWTRWNPDYGYFPNAWVSGGYILYEREISETLSPEEEIKRLETFLNKLRQPGTYEVGGVGGCTLMSKVALNKGVSFRRIPTLDVWGEDRHFCTRAQVLGLSLFVDTHYPAYHIYKEHDLAGVEAFIKECEAGGRPVPMTG
jgi:hypothetical protein